MTRLNGPRIVAGFGRSGTTWVQDVLAESNRLRAVFEPLHPYLLKSAGLEPAGYHGAGDADPVLQAYLEKYFFEDYWSLWADHRIILPSLLPDDRKPWSPQFLRGVATKSRSLAQNLHKYWSQRKFDERVIKLVRANMLLSWLQHTFNARIVYIVRHPAAVVLSQMRAPNAWYPKLALARLRADRAWMDAEGYRLAKLLESSLSDVEAHTLQWCIEVSTALRQAEESGIPVVFYEELIEYGRREWRRILAAVDLEVMPERQLIQRPSQQAWGKRAKSANLVRRYDSWMENVDQRTLSSVQRILDEMSMRLYRVHEALPIVAGRGEKNPTSEESRVEADD